MKELLRDKLLEKVAANKGGIFGSALGKKLFKNSPNAKRITENVITLTGAGAALGAGGAIAVGGAEAISDPIKKGLYKKRMMKENTWMKNEDSGTVSKMFNTLYRFSPEMAADPVVSGAFVRKGIEFKDVGIQPTDVKTLSDIQKSVSQRKSLSKSKAVFSPGDLSSMHSIAKPIGGSGAAASPLPAVLVLPKNISSGGA